MSNELRKEQVEYLFLDLEWNQPCGTTELADREAVQIGIVAADAQLKQLRSFGPNSNGLSWSELVEWWKTKTKSTARNADIKNELFVRLRDSLDSEAERIFFKEYYMSYKDYKDFPALIPQVYLHYDPFSKNVRGNSIIYMHQRMDFLMLLPDGIRIIFEIDGKQHYSKDEKAAPELYAEMVTDTRNLKSSRKMHVLVVC